MVVIWLRPFRREDGREDISSLDGAVTVNRLQQHPAGYDAEAEPTPLEEAGTTDPHGVADGWLANE